MKVNLVISTELLISTKVARYKILYLFYYYRYLNNINLKNLSYIDLITYRVRIKSNMKSISNTI